MRRNAQLLIGFAISALFLWLVIPSLHLQDVWQSLQEANYWWILPGVGVYFVGLWARTWRWHYMLRHLKPVSTRRLFPVVCIGYYGNNVYPLRAGEVIRSYVLKQREGVAIASSLATVIIERVFDGLVMVLFVFLALPFAPLPPVYRNLVIGITIALLLATILFVWMAAYPRYLARFYEWVAARFLPSRIRARTDELYLRFMEGLKSLASPTEVVMIFGTSVIVWLMETVKYWFVMHAFPFEVSFIVLMLMNGLVNLATTLPSAPGYIGTFDVPGIAVLVAFGVPDSIAASYTFTLHTALWLPVTLVGGYFFWREQLHWGDFQMAKDEVQAVKAKQG